MPSFPKNNTGAGVGAAMTVVLVFILQQFSVELGAGHVPIPDQWRWLVPILGAAITGLLAALTPYYSRSEAETGFRTVNPPPSGEDAPVVDASKIREMERPALRAESDQH